MQKKKEKERVIDKFIIENFKMSGDKPLHLEKIKSYESVSDENEHLYDFHLHFDG